MVETQTWIQTNNQLIATVPLQSEEEAQTIIAQYKAFLHNWQTLAHPTLLEIEKSEVNFKTIDGNNQLEITLLPKKINGFEQSNTIASSLTTMEKLFVVKQTLALDNYVQKNNLTLSWQMSHLYLHSIGICGWLPPLPTDFEKVTQNSQPNMIQFLFELFELETENVTHWRDLQKAGQMPWEWGAFLEYYLAASTDKKLSRLNSLKVFSFIFYQAWLYTTGNLLAMKDKMLTKEEYKTLHQLGVNLGLSEREMDKLNILAQQQNPSWTDLITILEEEA
jgi:hypothetical protein